MQKLPRHPVLSFLLLLLVTSAPVLADDWWHVTDMLDFTPHGTQPGLTHELYPSNMCRSCHRGVGATDAVTMPFNSWAGSMMANATRDPVFWAALDVANHDGAANGFPGVGDYCLRCHTPNGWYGGRVVKNGAGGSVDGSNGCLLQGDYDDVDVAGNDFSGESCHFCHRMMQQGPGGESAYLQNAAAWLDDTDCNGFGEPCRRGPYDYPGGTGEPPHAWAHSTYHQSSALCGNCHDVTTPDTSAGPLRTLRNASGVDTGIPFPVERTFSEWRGSDFGDVIFRDRLGDALTDVPALASGRICQDCHMPMSQDPMARACTLNDPRPGNVAVHSLAGGNTWIPGVISGQYGVALQRQPELAQTVLWARAMLQSSAQVQVTPAVFTPPVGSTPGTATLDVKVTNLSGHKFPTGYSEGRRAWLDVQLRDHNGVLIAESGAYDTGTALLTADAQSRIYEVQHGVWDAGTMQCKHTDGLGAAQFHFVLGNCIAKDNRIPPLGFLGGSNPEMQPVGVTYPTAPSGRLVNYDVAHYSFAVPVGTPLPLTASATLYYQTSSRDYIEFRRNEASANAFASEQSLCASARPTAFTVGPQTLTRGEYLYQLWSNPAYGKSPPENVASGTVGIGN